MYGDLESYANWKVRGVEYTSDEFELKAEASLFTGMEWVWLNKELVSKKRNWTSHSRHTFKAGDDQFLVSVKWRNLLTARIDITASQNGQQLFADARAFMKPWTSVFVFLSAVGLGVLLGRLAAWMGL